MANTFKVSTKADLLTSVISNTATNVLTAGATATHVLLSILVSNKTGTSADVDVYLVPASGDSIYIIRNAPVPAGSSLEIISGSKIIMEPSAVLRARADTASSLDLSISYLEQT